VAGAGLSVANEGPREPGPVDRLALLMLDEWRRVEPDKSVGPCLIATIADLARVAVAWSPAEVARSERIAAEARHALVAVERELAKARARVAELEAALEVTHATVDRVADLVGY
jgi:hypothetical protein